jgi:DNA-binding MarR family transcriptional regulator
VRKHLEHLSLLNRAFESKPRLGIMSELTASGAVDFVALKNRLGLTDGNLASHTRALEAAGYISSRKELAGGRVTTLFSVTGAGRQAFMDHTDALGLFLRGHDLLMMGDEETSW